MKQKEITKVFVGKKVLASQLELTELYAAKKDLCSFLLFQRCALSEPKGNGCDLFGAG